MAHAALTSLASVILQILPQEQRYISLCGEDQMKSLYENVILLQEFLEHISLKSFLPATDVLESRMRDTAYKMEETIELVVFSDPGKESESEGSESEGSSKGSESKESESKESEGEGSESEGSESKEPEIEVQLPTPEEFSTYFEEFHVLVEETMKMRKNLEDNALPRKQPLTTTTLSREGHGHKGTKVGLDMPLKEILDQVIGQKPTLQIVPITGMGGIGKTTLARASYEAPQTVRYFDVRFWVTVSQDYNIQQILRGLLPKAEQEDERLIEYVNKHLKCRRYLIVLDDMWDEKVWDRVRFAFPNDKNGSRVIITTRLAGVASYVCSSSPVHEMQFLNEDQSLDLLRTNVYGHEYCAPEFEDMGRIIANNCKGLPLAIVVIAGLLKFNKTIDYWEQVARNTDEKVTTSKDPLFEILSWSYTRLPPHLKACFLYMGTYKEDHEIKTNELVMIWAAEGFLKPKRCRSKEEVAEECLEELVQRSLVLVKERWYNGKIRTCVVHDVLRELSIRKAEEEKFYFDFTQSDDDSVDESTFRNVLAVQRRVSITNCSVDNFPFDTFFATTHSLILEEELGSVWVYLVQRFKLLRVLKNAYIEFESELSLLSTLTSLRYLHLYCRCTKSELLIPKSISKLQNLETLIVRPCDADVIFPLEIWKLQRLEHIIVAQGAARVPVPNQDCPNLQTLYWMSDMNFTKIWDKRTPNLKKLKLRYYVDDEQEYGMENILYLHQLEELSVCFDTNYNQSESDNSQSDNSQSDSQSYNSLSDKRPGLTNFVFPQNLKKLSLYNTEIPLENMSQIGLLPNLKELKLKLFSAVGEEWEPVEGEFLQLEYLKMEVLPIEYWRAESIHFPSLRKLLIWGCDSLTEVPESIGEIDTLEVLSVKGCSDEGMTSVQRIKEIQEELDNHLLQVTIILEDEE